MAVLMFFSFAFFSARAVFAVIIYGFENYISSQSCEYTECEAFESIFDMDIYYITQLVNLHPSVINDAFQEYQESTINEALIYYLEEKAAIIESELRYAVDNYDESYFNYEYTADTVVLPGYEEATASVDSAISSAEVTTSVPRNIEAAKAILENCKGTEFLAYETLVRTEAFTEQQFSYNSNISYSDDSELYIEISLPDYTLNENEAKKAFIERYNEIKESTTSADESDKIYAESALSQLDSFKYYAVDKNGGVYSNLNEDEKFGNIKSYLVYVHYDGTTVTTEGIDDILAENISSRIKNSDAKEVYIAVQDIMEEADDVYASIRAAYKEYSSPDFRFALAAIIISFILAVVLLLGFLCLCGHKNGEENCRTAYIDKLPTDIHFILSFGLIAAISVGTFWLLADIMGTYVYAKLVISMFDWGVAATLSVCYMLFIEWLASTVRIKKAGEKFFRKMLIVRAVFATGRFFRRLAQKFRYQPKRIKKTLFLLIGGYLIGNFVLFTLGAVAVNYHDALPFIICLIWIIAFNAGWLYFIIEYLKMLDTIIDASCRHIPADFGNKKVPESLKILASNLTNTNEALQEAVAKAVRDEQMKTELITNVSHDLKTPLTSLISYSDLLGKCDIQDETAQKYIGVIHTQSIKLKRLIEDLIEASKVSTGNVTINATKINLVELANQAIAEFAPEMEKNGNEIIFNEPESTPTAFADGAKTYRIISNLLSNAKKYSATNTRVYISVYTDGKNSCFEIKNISGEPLNISADELTERFVRGDKSRTREGNGLGLSIAKDLCVLQNGKLQLIIDGDLFKAIVQLPSAGNISAFSEEIENIE